ncbi:hypothetical protein TA3x_000275 [Tundrisphaera sp. TA3]|uniref:hypothetical protein n=1 Tax=Tundrisphaera sp. TA3 TaxID=3435775 RepID=UPI003EBAA17C
MQTRITTFEKRWAMPDRQCLAATFRLPFLLALLASLLIAPIWASGFAPGPAGPNPARRRNLAPPTTRIQAAAESYAMARMKALPCEEEERDQADAPGEARAPFQASRSFGILPDRRSFAPGSIPSPYPLRC